MSTTTDAPTAREQRAELHERLASSGNSSEQWTDVARQELHTTLSALSKKRGVDLSVSSAQCYRAGCITQLRHADQTSFGAIDDEIMGNVFANWSFAFTGPELHDDGTVTNVFVLFRPADEAQLTNGPRP